MELADCWRRLASVRDDDVGIKNNGNAIFIRLELSGG